MTRPVRQSRSGTDGFEFVEFTSPEPERLQRLFEQMGFVAVSKHRSKNVLRFAQGDINFILNMEPAGQPAAFRAAHGPSANAMAFRVKDAGAGAEAGGGARRQGGDGPVGPMELNIPAIEGIGGSNLYLVDRYGAAGDLRRRLPCRSRARRSGSPASGLTYIDHLTHNVHRGQMDTWADFYERIFNFREIRYFDIEGAQTGLFSKAMTSPCGKIRIPLNESQDEHSQIEEFLQGLRGEGIQHIALGTDDIFDTVEAMRDAGRDVPGHAGDLLRAARRPRAGPRREPAAPARRPHPDRRRADRGPGAAAADLHPEHDRPDLLRDHPAQGQRGLRRGQLQGAVRIDRARPDPPRRAAGEGA